ncbi:hypothetical protein, partial [Halomonas sp. AOP42-C2-25]|uniref:hypothetical protein n=1 Tax=Halomonas sp. AOP42-C2-25 TaxID=3457668 RepID=UPI004033425D
MPRLLDAHLDGCLATTAILPNRGFTTARRPECAAKPPTTRGAGAERLEAPLNRGYAATLLGGRRPGGAKRRVGGASRRQR